MIAAVLGPHGAGAQRPAPPASSPVAESRTEDCDKRRAVAASIERFASARAAGQRLEHLVAQMTEIEQRIIELPPAIGGACPEDLSIAALTDRFDPIRHEVASERRRLEINAKAWPERVKLAVLDRRVEIGMTREQVSAAWGQPRSIDVTPTTRQEQWTYAGPTYLYFTNGALAVIARAHKPPE